MNDTNSFTVWVDADACPKMVKEVIFKASFRLNLKVILVANSYLSIPKSPNIRLIQVSKGADVADNYIADNLQEGDIVITADIPLASIVVEKKAIGIDPRGELYTEENIGERLSMRNFMSELRDSGLASGGPAEFSLKDKERFANTFNKLLTQML